MYQSYHLFRSYHYSHWFHLNLLYLHRQFHWFLMYLKYLLHRQIYLPVATDNHSIPITAGYRYRSIKMLVLLWGIVDIVPM